MALPDKDTAQHWVGRRVHDEAGDEIGTCAALYVDDVTDAPEWLVLDLADERQVLVPIGGASESAGAVRVAFTRTTVLAAPSMGAGGKASNDEEARLYQHYGVPYSTAESDSVLPEGEDGSTGAAGTGADDRATAPTPDQAVAPVMPSMPGAAPMPGASPAAPVVGAEGPGPVQRDRADDKWTWQAPSVSGGGSTPPSTTSDGWKASNSSNGWMPSTASEPSTAAKLRGYLPAAVGAAGAAGLVAVGVIGVRRFRAARRPTPAARVEELSRARLEELRRVAERAAQVGAGLQSGLAHRAAELRSAAAQQSSETSTLARRRLSEVTAQAHDAGQNAAARAERLGRSSVERVAEPVLHGAEEVRQTWRSVLRTLSAAVGFGGGYVLGARAGRGRYEQMREQAEELMDRPQVREAREKLGLSGSDANSGQPATDASREPTSVDLRTAQDSTSPGRRA
jgi:hypothetical protein